MTEPGSNAPLDDGDPATGSIDDDLQTTLRWPGEPSTSDQDLRAAGLRRAPSVGTDTSATEEPIEGRLRAIERSMADMRADVGGLRAVILQMPDLDGLGLQIEHLEESLLSARPSTLPALAPLMEQLGRIATEVARTREVAEEAARKVDELAAAPPQQGSPPAADTGALGDLVHEIAELRTEVAHLRRRISLRAATPDGSP